MLDVFFNMAVIFFKSRILLLILFSVSQAMAAPSLVSRTPDTAFYYGQNLPVAALSIFDQVVVQPDHVTAGQRQQLQKRGTRVLGYVSVGEISKDDLAYIKLKPSWIAGKNPNWNSLVLDLRQPEVIDFLLKKYILPLKKAGYDGLFLDTLDSYQLVAKKKADRKVYEKGLITLIHRIKKVWPSSKILINRGFEIIPAIASLIDGVVAESLFSGYGGNKQGYQAVSKSDRQWLTHTLTKIRNYYHLPVTVIDYLPGNRWGEAEKLARRIYKLGFTPWVSDGHLDTMGIGRIRPVPRKILALYDDKKGEIFNNNVHRKLAEPLEYMGYQLEYLDINRTPLPTYSLRGRYAGIVGWFTGMPLKISKTKLCGWMKKQRETGLHMAFFSNLPDQLRCKKLFHLRFGSDLAGKKLTIIRQNSSVGRFEARLRIKRFLVPDVASTSLSSTPWLRLTSNNGKTVDPIVIDSWGGYALGPYVVVDGAEGTSKWLFNPFIFLRQSLRLAIIPSVDITTESGRRIMTAHIDGDGFVSRAEMEGREYDGKVMLNQILKKYQVPTTVSIIEAEVGPAGLYKKESPALEKIARAIFRLSNVEIATHTFSHPFFWQIFDGDYDVGPTPYGYNMPVPNYKPTLKREIIGSTHYINTRLAPKNKRVKMILWSGNTLPGASAVKMAYAQGLLNVNGGDTWPIPYRDSLSMIWPVGRPTAGGLQVYAPVLNENVYTNDWHGPFYGYREVIKTFKLLESPRRLKQIGIYYHFYSASKLASLSALRTVYNWALAQHPIPLFLSDYARRAIAFYQAALGKTLDGGWILNNARYIHTLRIPRDLGWPNLKRSRGVAGYNSGPDGIYLILSAHRPLIYFQKKPDNHVHLIESNGIVTTWKKTEKGILVGLSAYIPLEFSVESKNPCQLTLKRRTYFSHTEKENKQSHRQNFHFKFHKIENALLVCS